MVDPMDNIAKQAHQGSIAAIIQVLNEKLADSGVRTRAMLADGMLQLLCEASTTEQLERESLVARIQEILDAIAPRNIHHVNINSRIAREQQLLWLEEINRDPENQLLWSEKIAISRPNLFKRMASDFSAHQAERSKTPLPKKLEASIPKRRQNNFKNGIIWGSGLTAILVLGWLLFRSLFSPVKMSEVQARSSVNAIDPTTETTSPSDAAVESTADSDPFAEAVILAEQAAQDGQTAQSAAEWLELAAKWRKASDLMEQVSSDDPRYQTARERVQRYRQYSQMTQQKAQTIDG
ncbi:MAG: hypothetical protein SWY16_14700 [Cyanobacteriota bacterium]|nr:hypothetical protein [Cyanobacteriota bacterium]